ncbi:MAG: hypothetical protein V4650_04500 [Pseudomonadota bacterium]
MFRIACLSLTLLALAACGDQTADPVADPAATVAKSEACATRPPESAADYQAKLTTFKSEAGFAPGFTQGQLLDDEQEIAITVSEAGFDDGLGYEISYLANCAVFHYHAGNLYQQPDGRWTGTVQTGTGSDIPDGTPAFIAVIRTALLPNPDGGLPKAKTTVVGEYAVRINNPKR